MTFNYAINNLWHRNSDLINLMSKILNIFVGSLLISRSIRSWSVFGIFLPIVIALFTLFCLRIPRQTIIIIKCGQFREYFNNWRYHSDRDSYSMHYDTRKMQTFISCMYIKSILSTNIIFVITLIFFKLKLHQIQKEFKWFIEWKSSKY